MQFSQRSFLLFLVTTVIYGNNAAASSKKPHHLRKDADHVSKEKYHASHTNGKWVKGDIIPSCQSILLNYGKETADDLIERGLMEGPCENARGLSNLLWKERDEIDGSVLIPYEFTKGSHTKDERKNIVASADSLSKASNGLLKFIPRTSEQDYIKYTDTGGCSSYIGRVGGEQLMDIGWCKDKIHKSSVIHEHMHAIGFHHEQSRNDRDQHVKIITENIDPKFLLDFSIKKDSFNLGTKYDYDSIMHYGKYLGQEETGLVTIETIPVPNVPIGIAVGPSRTDKKQIRLLYQCIKGPRHLSELKKNPCTVDCKCFEGEPGCNSDNGSCVGDLVCSDNNICTPTITTTRLCKERCSRRKKKWRFICSHHRKKCGGCAECKNVKLECRRKKCRNHPKEWRKKCRWPNVCAGCKQCLSV